MAIDPDNAPLQPAGPPYVDSQFPSFFEGFWNLVSHPFRTLGDKLDPTLQPSDFSMPGSPGPALGSAAQEASGQTYSGDSIANQAGAAAVGAGKAAFDFLKWIKEHIVLIAIVVFLILFAPTINAMAKVVSAKARN